MIFANSRGEILDFPGLSMAGRSGANCLPPSREDLIPLPAGSELFVLPGRTPVGFEPGSGRVAQVLENPLTPADGLQAVAAFMAPAHTAILGAAFVRSKPDLAPLPLFAYTAVGWHKGRFWVAAFRSDPDRRQDSDQFHQPTIRIRTTKRLRAFPNNRLVQHLGKCCLTYGCPAARNYFLDRWEAPLPTSPACNARCLGCISLQPSGCCPSTQERIRFVPTPKEIAEVAIRHLRKAPKPVVSFGQGCEGEPLLQADTIAEAIGLIRRQTARGTINLNSNASLPGAVDRLAKAGLNSIRVSMNSARKIPYERYYRPTNYAFAEVLDSIKVMKGAGRFVSLNYFILPGFTDDPEEFAALCEIIAHYQPDLIQLRNLNMDPDWYLDTVGHAPQNPAMGMRAWLAALRERFPALRYGYFNPWLAHDEGALEDHSS